MLYKILKVLYTTTYPKQHINVILVIVVVSFILM